MNNHQPFNTVGEQGYRDLLQHILDNGYQVDKERTGTGTIVSPTPHQLHFPNVGEQFPLFTTKKVSFNMLACEMLWFIEGSTNTKRLAEIGSPAMKRMWDKWSDEVGELGPVYGKQWRTFTSVNNVGVAILDQLKQAIRTIKDNPTSRRIIVSAWNPVQIDMMALPPCHLMYQFTCEPISYEESKGYVDKVLKPDSSMVMPNYKLHLHLTQRSCDMFLGVPFNVAQYALLLLMVSKVTNTVPGGFTWTGVNCHIYQNHVDPVKKQVGREVYYPPKVVWMPELGVESIDDFKREHFTIKNYEHHPAIKAPVSI